jgi:hypothetical protein
VKSMIELNIDHKGIQAAFKWFEEWISNSTLGKAVPGGNSLRRLNDHGVTGRRCLESVMALWLYAYPGRMEKLSTTGNTSATGSGGT